jgi:hypothetical protein
MKDYEFYRKFANTPLNERDIVIKGNYNEEKLTLNDIYTEIKAIDDKIRPDEIRKQRLLQLLDETVF